MAIESMLVPTEARGWPAVLNNLFQPVSIEDSIDLEVQGVFPAPLKDAQSFLSSETTEAENNSW
jgi:hypothetical protein